MERVDEYLVEGAALKRLIREYEHYGYLCIGVDFDNVLAPLEDSTATYNLVIQLIKDLRASINCKIVCWTANPNIEHVKSYLAKHEIPYDGINCDGINVSYACRKPVFSALLDDRAGLKETYGYLKEFLQIIINKKQNNQIK
jgi:hypothetical protein